MKLITALLALATLAGCAAPDIDWSNADHACSTRCSDEYNACLSSNPLTPGIQKLNCNSSLKVCASSCGGKIVSN